MVEEFYLEVRRSRPKRPLAEGEQSSAEELSLLLCRRVGEARKAVATLSPIPILHRGEGHPHIAPADRAHAWEELTRWIVYLIITPDPAVQEGQYQNRLKAENWAHGHAEQPREDELYNWRTDKATLERLRPRCVHIAQTMCDAVGHPKREDFDRLYPNPYEDEDLSDRARQAVRDLRAAFGSEILTKGTCLASRGSAMMGTKDYDC